MSDHDDGAPFYFAMRRPPTATVMDEDIYLTVTAGVPSDPTEVESIDIILSVAFAMHVIVQLTQAVETAMRNQAR
jgi:hypothetical protein